MKIVTPTQDHLPYYKAALERGWSPNDMDGERHRLRELGEIEADSATFLAQMTDREAAAGDVELPDGSFVKRLPGIRRWMWDEGSDEPFCGNIGFRWQPGTEELPPHLLGHVGYAVVPWKRGHGYAAQALRQILPEARALGMRWISITCDKGNLASVRTIENAGGLHTGTRAMPDGYRTEQRQSVEWYRIEL